MATASGAGMKNQGSMAQTAFAGNQAQAPQGVQGNSTTGAQTTPLSGPAPIMTQSPGKPIQAGVGGSPLSPDAAQPTGSMPDPAIGTPPPAAPPDVTGAPATPVGTSTPALGAGTSVGASKTPIPAGTLSPSGTPVNPDGGYTNPDGSHDWMPGYGPQMSFGGQEISTGKAPTTPDPGDPDSVAQRGTPQWRAAYAAHDAWIKSQLDAGLHLADLGLTPTRGGGLSSYMRYGGYTPSGGASPAASTTPAVDPNTGMAAAPVAGSGGYLPGTAGAATTNPDVSAIITALLGSGSQLGGTQAQ